MMTPGVAEPAPETWADDVLDRLPALTGVQVLVVDDEPDVLDAISAVLQECGADVIPAASGGEALAALHRMRPDVLVSDIAMPGMDGHRLMRRIRTLGVEHGGSIPAAALTAYASTADRTRALLAGYQVYLPKPFEPAELACLVARLAGRNPST